jgi:Zinc dependent phospholipase C
LSLLSFHPTTASAYAVLAHQALIDVVWESQLKPLLHHKFPSATEDELDAAEAYAYGGSIVQDLGYYPYGSPFFSDLTHYLRSGDFVAALLENAQDVDEYAFALGALAHYVSDNDGHPMATNRAVPMLYPALRKKYGDTITYEDDRLAHVKTEFGFDVLQVAQRRYAPEEFHDFIGFEVSPELLERSFQQVYGLPLKSVIPDEQQALNSYRHAVSKIIPKATRIAWTLKRDEITAAEPSLTHKKFVYYLSRAQYEKEWGKDYTRPTFSDKFLAFLYRLLPKFGPLRVLQFKTPTPEAERLFEASFNSAVTKYRAMLRDERNAQLHLPNTNFDMGGECYPGKYRLNDEAHAKLLHQLAANNFGGISPELRAELLGFYDHPDAPYYTRKDPRAWAQVQTEVELLKAASTTASGNSQSQARTPR